MHGFPLSIVETSIIHRNFNLDRASPKDRAAVSVPSSEMQSRILLGSASNCPFMLPHAANLRRLIKQNLGIIKKYLKNSFPGNIFLLNQEIVLIAIRAALSTLGGGRGVTGWLARSARGAEFHG